jgi:hypothetical protein
MSWRVDCWTLAWRRQIAFFIFILLFSKGDSFRYLFINFLFVSCEGGWCIKMFSEIKMLCAVSLNILYTLIPTFRRISLLIIYKEKKEDMK